MIQKMKFLAFVTVLVATAIINAEKKSYEGYKLYKVVPKNEHDVQILEYISESGIGDFWNDHLKVNEDVRIMVPEELQLVFVGRLAAANIEVKTIIEDVQKAIDDQMRPANVHRTSQFLSLDWDSYHNLEDIEKWLDELVAEYPGIVSPVTMGIRSVENREIKGIIINYNLDSPKPAAMIEGTIHAREWISPATVTWIIKEFLTSSDPDVRSMAENLEWHIFPVVNPDGYYYTFNNNRLWRKNRSTASFTSCSHLAVEDDLSNGVDLNRNFDFYWMSAGASNDSCTQTYAGTSPASEPETQAIVQYVLDLKAKGDIIYYLSFHSWSQLFVVPYSHVATTADSAPDNFDHLMEIASNSANRLNERYGTNYRVGIASEVLYVMSGGSFDWAKMYGEAAVSYLIELRDLGEYGFLLPASQIIPNNLEVMDAMIELDQTTRRLGYYSSSVSLVYSLTLLVSGMIFVKLFN